MPRRSKPAFTLGTTVLLIGRAWADPIPVVAVTVGLHAPSAERVASVTSAIGSDALAGEGLSHAVTPSLGDPPLVGDPLAPQRVAAARAVRLHHLVGESLTLDQAVVPIIAAMESQPRALASNDENRHDYLLLQTMAGWSEFRIQGRTEEADARFRQVVIMDPSWPVSSRDYPPEVVRHHAAAVAAVARRPHGELTVNVLGSQGCSVRVDGRAVGEAARSTGPLLEGDHWVTATCATLPPPRLHPVHVTADRTTLVTLDPLFDVHADTSNGFTLRVDAGTPDAEINREAASVGRAVNARQVVVVTDDAVRVVDVARSDTPTPVNDIATLGRLLHPVPPTPAAIPSVPVDHRDDAPSSSSSVGPIVLLTAGGVGVAAAGVFYLLRVTALGAVNCPREGSQYNCSEMQAGAANSDTSRATTMTEASAIALGVGLAAGAGGLIWMLAGRSSHPRLSGSIMPTGQGLVGGLSGTF